MFAFFLPLWALLVPAWADEPGERRLTTPSPPVSAKQPPRLQQVRQQPTPHLGPAQIPQTAYHEELARRIRYLQQQGDRILAPGASDHGYIQSLSRQRPLQVGTTVTLALTQPATPGTLFTVYRPGPVLHDPRNGQARGTVAYRLGQLHLRETSPGGGWGELTTLLQEIQPGDRLLHETLPLPEATPHTRTEHTLHGLILALQDAWEEVGQDHVAIVSLGRQDRVAPGLRLRIHHQPPPDHDPYSAAPLPPHTEPIGEAILVWIGEWASLALLGPTSHPVSRGDSVSNW
jgi:hypothetical protein